MENSIHFSCLHTEEGFGDLAYALGALPHTATSYQFPNTKGAGIIKKVNLYAGVQAAAFNFNLEKDYVLYKDSCKGETVRTFSFTYILTPEALVLQNINEHAQVPLHGVTPLLFSADDVQLKFKLHSKRLVKVLTITTPAAWLLRQAENTGSTSEETMKTLTQANMPLVLQESCAGSELTEASMVHAALVNGSFDQPTMMNHVLNLINTFWKKIHNHKRHVVENRIMHAEKLIEAESILMEHLTRDLPRLSIIAQRVALSESTLKRYFKVMFGRSVYDYYLEKKMQVARNILQEDCLSVNEVADMVGYEKVSNFIKVFKKFHGFSPGTIKKRNHLKVSLGV
ncbi:MAG: AraC family transcriptional regulator [Chitinophagaceae bacterium]